MKYMETKLDKIKRKFKYVGYHGDVEKVVKEYLDINDQLRQMDVAMAKSNYELLEMFLNVIPVELKLYSQKFKEIVRDLKKKHVSEQKYRDNPRDLPQCTLFEETTSRISGN